jgi:hypothetical protein
MCDSNTEHRRAAIWAIVAADLAEAENWALHQTRLKEAAVARVDESTRPAGMSCAVRVLRAFRRGVK